MDIGAIIAVVTSFITYIFGILAKKFNWMDKSYIPLQNLVIGCVSGLIVYGLGLQENMGRSVMLCVISAFGAGGAYDFLKGPSETSQDKE